MTRPANLHAVHACLADTISALQAQGLPVPTALHRAMALGRHNLSVERAHKTRQVPLSRTAALFFQKGKGHGRKAKAGQRIVPYATREEMTLNADGTLAPLTPGSTQPTTFVNHSAGIRKTARFTFPAPY